jgi:hypothetical protein
MSATNECPKIVDGTPTGLYAFDWRQVWRVSIDGNAYRIWEQTMPRIDDTVLDRAIFLYGSEDDADEGANSGGSGFLVGEARDDGDGRHIYAVTNSHVIAGGCPVIRLNTREGAVKTVPLDSNAWISPQWRRPSRRAD